MMKSWHFVLIVFSLNFFGPLQAENKARIKRYPDEDPLNFEFTVPSDLFVVKNRNPTEQPPATSTCNVPVKSFDDEFLRFLKRIGLENLTDAEVEDLKNLFVLLLNPDLFPTEEPDEPSTDEPMDDNDNDEPRTTRKLMSKTTRKTLTFRKTTTTRKTTTKRTTTLRGKLSVLKFKGKTTTKQAQTTRRGAQATANDSNDNFDRFLEALGVDSGSTAERENLLRLFELWQESTRPVTTQRTTRKSMVKFNVNPDEGSGNTPKNLSPLKPQQGALLPKTGGAPRNVKNVLQQLTGLLKNGDSSSMRLPKPQLNFGSKLPQANGKARNLVNKLSPNNRRNQKNCNCANCPN